MPALPQSMLENVGVFSNKKGTNHLIINIVSEGRGELAWCRNIVVRGELWVDVAGMTEWN